VRRLYSRIYLHLLGVLLVVGLAVSLLIAFGQRGAFQRQVAERVARHVGALVAESWDDPPALERRLAQLRRDLEVSVTVRGPDGQVLAAAGAPLPALTAAELARVEQGEVAVRRRPVWVMAWALRDPASGRLRGVVQAGAPPQMRFGALWRPALAVLAVLLVVALMAGPLARRISRPVERLTEAARRLGAGDLAARVPDAPSRHRRHRPPDELRELTAAFNDMAERLERLVQGQKELLANVSHELRSPLARVRVALALVPRQGDADARVGAVEADLAELERLIDDVLTASRLEATGLPPHPGPVELGELLVEVAARAREDPVTAGAEVRVAGGPPVRIRADRALLRRALANLVENAAKYGRPPIELGVAATPDGVTLWVADRGEGIPQEERERVLAPFYRLDRARTPGDGSAPRGFGLGLTLARRVAEVHGGRILIGPAGREDGRERGCRVTLALPAGDLDGSRVAVSPGA
jgi:signal transduction histidine kinase